MTSGSDAADYEQERETMVEEQLVRRGIDDPRVIEAFRKVPRHEFVNPEQRSHAYEDRALPTASGQTISQPYMVATMTEVLEVEPGNSVLEVGTGSGYQTAILAELGADVFTVEKEPMLSNRAKKTLEELGYGDSVQFEVGDGTKGWPQHAPYDRILVTAAAPKLPDALERQAADTARIVLPEGSKSKQNLVIYERHDGGQWSKTSSTSCVFVPLTGEEGWDGESQ